MLLQATNQLNSSCKNGAKERNQQEKLHICAKVAEGIKPEKPCYERVIADQCKLFIKKLLTLFNNLKIVKL